MSEADTSFFQDLERTAKGLSMGSSTEASHELRAMFDTIRGSTAQQVMAAPPTAADNLPDGKGRLVPLLLSISKSTRALTALKLGELDFHSGQDEMLLALDEGVPITVSKLADELNVRPSTVSKMLDRLMLKGLVERTTDKRDARRTVVRITPAGLDARSLLLKLRSELNADLMSSFPGDPDAMLTALETVAVTLRARLSRLR